MDQKPESRMERKRLETRSKIITNAVALFDQFGLDAVTMEQIAETADIAKGTLYNYYPSKEAIINAYLQRTFEEKNPQRISRFHLLPDTRARLTALLTVLIEGIRSKKEIFEIFMVYRMKQVVSFQPVPQEEESGLSALILDIIQLGQAQGDLRTDLPVEMLSDFMEFILIEAVKPFYLDTEHYQATETIAACVDLFLRGSQREA